MPTDTTRNRLYSALCVAVLLGFLSVISSAQAQDPAEYIGRLDVLAPAAEAGTYIAGVSDTAGAPHPPEAGFGPFSVALVDSEYNVGNPDATPDQGCDGYKNADEVVGKIALVRDGGCDRLQKYYKAVQAQAQGILIYADDVEPDDDSTLVTDYAWPAQVIIFFYGLYITRYRGERLRAAVEAGEEVLVSLRSEPPTTPTEPSASTLPGLAVSVAPNPVRGEAQVYVTAPAPTLARLSVFDLLGREVLHLPEVALPAGRHPISLDVGALPAGTYTLRLRTEGRVVSHRFTIVR